MEAFGATLEVFETPEKKVHPGLFGEWETKVNEIIPELGAYFTDQFNNKHHPEGYRPLGHEIVSSAQGWRTSSWVRGGSRQIRE